MTYSHRTIKTRNEKVNTKKHKARIEVSFIYTQQRLERSKKQRHRRNRMNDFANIRVWEDGDNASTNPIVIVDDEVSEEEEVMKNSSSKKKSKRNKKKRNRRRRKKVSDEESSIADSMLSSILSESDDDDGRRTFLTTLTEDKEPGSVTVVDGNYGVGVGVGVGNNGYLMGKKPSSSSSNQYHYFDSNTNSISNACSTTNPFVDEDHDGKNHRNTINSNPFADDDDMSNMDAAPPVSSSNPFDDEDRDHEDDDEIDNTYDQLGKRTYNVVVTTKPAPNTNPFDDEEHDDVDTDEDEFMSFEDGDADEEEAVNEESEEEDDDDEDIIESSKRLLRCVDQRIQYQQQNDEVQSLKATIQQMKVQAEGMAVQLRRAVETKCDLVLSQNEMERRHEQGQIVKDNEMKGLRLHIQDILETQSSSELNFMNEISFLAKKLEVEQTKYRRDIVKKDYQITELEMRIEVMRVGSVRNSNRFNSDGDDDASINSYASKKSSGYNNRKMIIHVE